MKVLIIAPHPDDETIGAGGTLARHIALGDEVSWCVVTQGYSPPWPKETLVSASQQIDQVQKVYGLQEVFRLGYPTVKLNTVPHVELCTSIQSVMKKCKPDIVYTSSRNDVNLDHRIVYDCTIIATRPLPGNVVRRVLSYEIGYTNHFGLPTGGVIFSPNVFIDISLYLDKKLEAMKCYKTELREAPHPRSIDGIKLLAKARGLSLGFEFAECFELVREIL